MKNIPLIFNTKVLPLQSHLHAVILTQSDIALNNVAFLSPPLTNMIISWYKPEIPLIHSWDFKFGPKPSLVHERN